MGKAMTQPNDKAVTNLPENFGKIDSEKLKASLNLQKHTKLKRLLEWITEGQDDPKSTFLQGIRMPKQSKEEKVGSSVSHNV